MQETSELVAAVARYASECSGCTFQETPGRCHPVLCITLEIPVCKALPSGEGTCVNMDFDRPCPADAKDGMACDPAKYDYCHSNGPGSPTCACAGAPGAARWFCFPGAGA